MKLSTKSRYATRALIELGLQYGEGPVKLKDISATQDISLKYLEQVMFPLRISGYVKTMKGSQGGYILARHPDSITLLEIVECVEGPIAPVDCVDHAELCERSDQCVTRGAWIGLKNVIRSELGKITLAELVSKQKQLKG
jgi:Rrf2 family transcriptional regulator, cysteine metabolism repressor